MRWILIPAAVVALLAVPAAAQETGGFALQFDGADDWVDFGAGPTAAAPLTLEAWVKPTRATTERQLIAGPFGADRTGCYGGAGFRMHPGSDTTPGVLAFTLGLAGCGNDGHIDGPVPVLGQWYHLAGTYDGTTMRFYVDGLLVGERTDVGYTPHPRFVAGATFNQRINRPEFYFAGEIDDLRLWNHVRTETEIDEGRWQDLQGNETGLAAYWNLDDGSGQTATELVGGIYNGRLGDSTGVDPADPVWVSTGEPPTLEESLEELIRTVEDLGLPRRFERRLTAQLRIALRLLQDEWAANDKAAILLLKAFVRSVSHRAGRRLPVATADELVESALDLVDQIRDRVATNEASRAGHRNRRSARVDRRGGKD